MKLKHGEFATQLVADQTAKGSNKELQFIGYQHRPEPSDRTRWNEEEAKPSRDVVLA